MSFATMTWADAELAFRGRGPPPVPRRISRVFVLWALLWLGSHAVPASAATPARNARLSIFARMSASFSTWNRSHPSPDLRHVLIRTASAKPNAALHLPLEAGAT